MNRVIVACIALVMVFAFPAASLADHLHGEVQEIIIKIETEDGVKWYQVGKDMELINIREGDRVHFDCRRTKGCRGRRVDELGMRPDGRGQDEMIP
jgi:hypothetical protein